MTAGNKLSFGIKTAQSRTRSPRLVLAHVWEGTEW
jgi:hypothetical protein